MGDLHHVGVDIVKEAVSTSTVYPDVRNMIMSAKCMIGLPTRMNIVTQ